MSDGQAAEAKIGQDGQAPFLAGGGEMGAMIRATDWSETPLGAAEGWSPALRMMVSFLLANRFPLLLWWGPHYVSIYNDAYRPILGTKHPRSLGQPVSECWSEIWHILKPLIDAPFNGGPATWMEDIELEIQIVDEQPPGRERDGARGDGKTILVVEDQPDVLEVIEIFLDGLDYRILKAADGVAARKLLESNEAIDLLLTDIVMPNGVSGLDLAQDARRLRQDLKIVLVSGYLRDIDNRSDGLGGLIFLEKPFRQTELADTIAAALGGR